MFPAYPFPRYYHVDRLFQFPDFLLPSHVTPKKPRYPTSALSISCFLMLIPSLFPRFHSNTPLFPFPPHFSPFHFSTSSCPYISPVSSSYVYKSIYTLYLDSRRIILFDSHWKLNKSYRVVSQPSQSSFLFAFLRPRPLATLRHFSPLRYDLRQFSPDARVLEYSLETCPGIILGP